MSRLKDLQKILDTGFDHGKIGDKSPTVEYNIHSAGDPPFLEQQNFTPKSSKVTSKDNKKYIEALESLIYFKDQKKNQKVKNSCIINHGPIRVGYKAGASVS